MNMMPSKSTGPKLVPWALLLYCLMANGCSPLGTVPADEFWSRDFDRRPDTIQLPKQSSGQQSPTQILRTRYLTADEDKSNGDANGKKNGNGNGNGENGKKDEPKNPPKTLMSWAFGPETEEPETGEEEPIATDRPDFTEASSNVGRGRVQLESGYTYIQDRRNGTTTRRHSYPEALLRIGMFADWFELRLGQNFGSESTTGPGGRDVAVGAEDMYLGIGLALTEQKGIFPESRIILQARVPTGTSDFSDDKFLPGFNYLYGWDVIPDLISFAGSSQINRVVDGVGHSHTQVAQALTVGYTLTQKLGAYTEFFGLFPSGSIDPDGGPEYYFDGGFFYRFTPNFQVDIRAGVGLNRHADDFFAGSGFAVRY